MTALDAEDRALRNGIELARDLMLAQSQGRMQYMLGVLNDAEPAALAYALMRLVVMTDALALRACGGDRRGVLQLIRNSNRHIEADIASTLERLHPSKRRGRGTNP